LKERGSLRAEPTTAPPRVGIAAGGGVNADGGGSLGLLEYHQYGTSTAATMKIVSRARDCRFTF
jgi:hypothetical protein